MFQFCPNCKSDKLKFNNNHYWTCGDCDFLYYHNAAAAVAGIIVFKDKILFTVRGKEPQKDKLDLPGGFIDHNESLEEGLSREVNEELQLDIPASNWRYFCSFPNEYKYKTIEYYTMDCIFICELTSLPVLKLEKSEVSDVKWINKAEINKAHIAFRSLYNALQKYSLSY